MLHIFPKFYSAVPHILYGILCIVTLSLKQAPGLQPALQNGTANCMDSPGCASKTETKKYRFITQSIKYFNNCLISNIDLI